MSSALPLWLRASMASSTSWGALIAAPDPWRKVFNIVWVIHSEDAWDLRDLQKLRGGLRIHSDQREIDLEGTDWSQVTTDELILLLTGWLEAEAGRVTLAQLAGVDPHVQEQWANRFYLETLIRLGELSKPPEASLGERLSIPLGLSAALAPKTWLATELARRADSHKPGAAAALIRIRTAIERAEGVGDSNLNHRVELGELNRAVDDASRYLRPGLRRWMRIFGCSDGAVTAGLLDADGEQFLVVERKWGNLDPLQVLSACLDGRLDIASRAVAESLSRRAKREAKRVEHEIVFDFHSEEPREDDAYSAHDDSVLRRVRESLQLTHRRHVEDEDLKRAFTAIEKNENLNPRLRHYVSARRAGKNQKDAAAEVGVKPRMARYYEKQLGELFKQAP